MKHLVIAVFIAAALVLASASGATPKRTVIHTVPGGADLHISVGYGSVWVGTHRGYYLYRINPKTNAKRAIEIPQNTCSNPVFADGFVFQSGCNDTMTSLQISAKTNHVGRHLPGVAGFVGAGSLWLVDQTFRIARVDPRTGVELAWIDPKVDVSQYGAAVGLLDGGVWVCSDSAVSRIDVLTNKVTEVIPLPNSQISGDVPGGNLGGDYGVVFGGKLWVTNPAGLYEVDPATHTARLLPIKVTPMSEFGDLYVVAGAGSLWMRTSNTSVARIDPATGKVVGRFAASGGGGGIAVGFGSLWVANAGADTIWRYPIH
ncbi:MAG: hypothetical protein ACTHKS_08300 [Gaiellaceae bacterium]